MLALAVVFLIPLTVLHGQQSSPPAQDQQKPQVPTFRAEANLVRVDAYVSANGRSVGDLGPEDFDVLEDGVRQRVEAFAYVRKGEVMPGARGAVASEAPGRLVVLFIDTYHLPWVDRERLERRQVDKRTPQPLFFPPVLPPPLPDDQMLRTAMREIVNRVVGPNDRVAVLTPDMWAGAPAFGEKRTVMEELATRPLEAYATGQRPPEWIKYEACFPNGPWIEPEMRVRYRLNRTFTALDELVANLELLREERKAVLVVTRGWDPPPRILGYHDPRRGQGLDDSYCSSERFALAEKDFTVWFGKIKDQARRANVAFYPVYAHPLITYGQEGPDIDEQTRRFERQWGNLQETNPAITTRVTADFAAIDNDRRLWHDWLTEFAKDTSGRAILKMDDFDSGLREIADGLSSYYLLGYYSTNNRRDGTYRKIAVNVRRKDVNVRARPGYRAVMPPETSLPPRPDPVAPAINAAFSPLARFRADVPFHLSGTSEWVAEAAGWRLRVVGEVAAESMTGARMKDGWRAEITLVAPDGKMLGAAGVSVKAGQRSFVVSYPSAGTMAPGDYTLRAKAFGGDQETVFEDRQTVTVPATAASGGDLAVGTPLLFRRPNMPRSVFEPTADQRYTRREILMVEVPLVGGAHEPSVRLIDRQGQPRDLGIEPVVAGRAGSVVISVTMPLSSVAPGDYVLEIVPVKALPEKKVYVGFRVVP
ncbi:MAG: VWA domain-containing protein [Bacteroidales bacterium]